MKSLFILLVFGLVLFFIADVFAGFLATAIVYADRGIFVFDFEDVISSYFQKGYVGGLILGVGIWVKSILIKK